MTCATGHPGDGERAGVCAGVGSTDKYFPVVCVDDRVNPLVVDPDPVHAVCVKKDQNGKPTTIPVTINWFTATGVPLSITLNEEGCVKNVVCRGGHCMAQTLNNPGKQCKYTVRAGGKILDPIIIIDTCCP